jgi:outer membrane receptor protein involved in Fe transport
LKVCTLIVLALAVLAEANLASAQTHGTVRNAQGGPVAGAAVSDLSGKTLAATDAEGAFTLEHAPRQIEVTAAHYLTAVVNVRAGQPLRVVLARPLETVTVTAYRSPLGEEDSPASTRMMDRRQLEQAAPPALDGKLREVPGFELYRRSSSLVANPTTEGVSLRGLGSTAASRSLVVLDDVPLNDPYGGWIHWEELPELAVQSVEVVRGGASDLYGSSAIGGVISVVPVRPQGNGVVVSASGGSESTLDDSVLATGKRGPWAGLASAGLIATDGYTLIAPDQRGPIDRPSNVHAQNALVEGQRALPENGRAFVRANALNESRHNGTPDQYNLTRLWRAAGGADWRDWSLRLYGSNEHFRQTFSSVNAPRTSEKLTKFQFDPADELGAAARWRHAVGSHALLLAGADTHDVRATDNETLLVGAGGTTAIAARQRLTGAWGEALYTPAAWTLSASARVDHFANFNVRQTSIPPKTSAPATTLPSWSQTVFDPRLGVVRRLTPWLRWSASGFRAFRTPTENELYRSFQVGSEVTEANPNLRSERATGWETGAQADLRRWGSSARASYFWTQVNRPIASLTLSVTPTSVLLKRENLGQIESRGVSLDYAMRPAEWIAIEGGYRYADATVTKNAPEPQLIGNWIPEVPRNMATAQVRFTRARWGLLSLQGRYGGRAYDDDANLFLLHSYFQLDAYGQHALGRHWLVFADGENLFDRAIEAGKTPQTTLGTPRLARLGLRVRFGE